MHVKIFHNTIRSFCTNIELFIFSSYQNLNTARIYVYEFPEHIFRSPGAFIKQHHHSAGSSVNTVIYKQVICLDVRLSDLWKMSWAIWPWIQDLDVSNLFVKTIDKAFLREFYVILVRYFKANLKANGFAYSRQNSTPAIPAHRDLDI